MNSAAIFISLVLSLGAGDTAKAGFQPDGPDLTGFADAKKLILYSVDPSFGKAAGKTKKIGGWKIIGSVELKSRDDRIYVANALKSALASSTGDSAFCFNPRHALRVVTKENKVAVFTICFECSQMKHKTGNTEDSYTIGPKGERNLNAMLTKHGIALAPKAK